MHFRSRGALSLKKEGCLLLISAVSKQSLPIEDHVGKRLREETHKYSIRMITAALTPHLLLIEFALYNMSYQ